VSAAGTEPRATRERAAEALASIRTDDQKRWIATLFGAAVGLLAAAFDPLGIVLGGALVAIPARDTLRGIGSALGFGLLVVAIFLLQLVVAGSLGPAAGMGLPFALPIGIGLGLSLLGGLVRGLI